MDVHTRGSFNERDDSVIFTVDKSADSELTKHPISKKAKAALPPRCLDILQPWTQVPDPIKKRNRVRTQEERKCTIRKSIEETKKKNGFVKKKDVIAKQSRKITEAIKKNVPKRGEFKKNIWKDDDKNPLGDTTWLEEETNRHVLKNMGKLRIRQPQSYAKNPSKAKPSGLPATEMPHPGISYNPSFTDHQQLLREIAEKEMKLMKEEEHLKRVTSSMFSKISPEENSQRWMTEMSEGLNPSGDLDNENGGEYMAINPPTSFSKKKTLKTRRKQKEAKKEALEKLKQRIEKKKTADVYKLRRMEKEITEKEQKWAAVREKRAKKKASEENMTKKLSKRKFEEPDLPFSRPHEITGNLRALKPEGNILVDRYYSMQKRNVLEVTAKQLKCHRRKVKKFVKPSHRIEESPTVTKSK
ncbi:ribosome biogenesis protein NOP53-like [Macrosteles quadrilineatus]|uniref:ribosome biogenesis protein NOP53-like n=1 Tax=Macrosteles quadrilineatus TaxID=74068 RepID=UPI0023E1EDBA|nr:ribosome biogenesis protein NOP53-like [Macrosteles quadrilineatus]